MREELLEAIKEIQQPRSFFQLERFVLGQHPTPEMQYYQTLLELNGLITNHRLAEIAVKKQEIKIARLKVSADEIDLLKAQELEIGLEQSKIAMIGNQREIDHLTKIWESFANRFTREEIENSQYLYWQARLTNNAKAMLMGGASVSPAHIEAMEQAGVLDQFVEEVQKQKKELK
jgi:hypothetical protein